MVLQQSMAIGMPGLQEMIVIFLVMLLIFGAKLPDVARSLGKIFSEVQHGFNQFKAELMNPKNSSHPHSTPGIPRPKDLPPPENHPIYPEHPIDERDDENKSDASKPDTPSERPDNETSPNLEYSDLMPGEPDTGERNDKDSDPPKDDKTGNPDAES